MRMTYLACKSCCFASRICDSSIYQEIWNIYIYIYICLYIYIYRERERFMYFMYSQRAAGQGDAKAHYKIHRAPIGASGAVVFAALSPHLGRPRAADPMTKGRL